MDGEDSVSDPRVAERGRVVLFFGDIRSCRVREVLSTVDDGVESDAVGMDAVARLLIASVRAERYAWTASRSSLSSSSSVGRSVIFSATVCNVRERSLGRDMS